MIIKLDSVSKIKLSRLTQFMLDKNHQMSGGPEKKFPFMSIKSANLSGSCYAVTLDVSTQAFQKTEGEKGHYQAIKEPRHISDLWAVIVEEDPK